MQADSHKDNKLNNRKLTQNSKLVEQGRPMCLSNLFINHPCKLVTTAIILLGLLTFFVYKKDYFMLTPDTNRQYMVFSDQKTIDWDK